MQKYKADEDYMVRATAAEGRIRAFAVRATETVRAAQRIHGTSPNVTAALGRLLTGGLMMGAMMKDAEDRLTLMIRSDGPIRGLTVTADCNGHVKGYPSVSRVELVNRRPGKLDVGASVGHGTLTVVRDEGMREPYSSQIALVSGEIAEDLTVYFAESEQVPSSVGLGVLVDTDESVKNAGGFIIQLMPGATDEDIDGLETALRSMKPITELLAEGRTPEEILESVLGEQGFELLSDMPVMYRCDCSRDRVSRALISLGKNELQKLADEGNPVDMSCSFCKKKYTFTPEEIRAMAER